MKTLVPGPRPRYPGEFILAVQRDPLGFLERQARRHGDLFRYQVGPQQIYVVSRPEHIGTILTGRPDHFEKGRALRRARRLLGEGLLTAEGDEHLRRRRLIQPAFHRRRIERYRQDMVEVARRFASNRSPGERFDVHREMMALTLEVVAKAVLGTSIGDKSEVIREALEQSLGQFRLLVLPFFELLEKLPLPGLRRFEKAQAVLDEIVYNIIAEHRAGRGDPDDLVSWLLETDLTDRQLRDEVLTILLAGHETTANALTFAFHLLSHNPATEERLAEELETVLAGRPPEPADVERLTYTRQVITETMRLLPPAWLVARRCLVDVRLDDVVIPADSIILMCQWLVHRDARHYQDPLAFRPERWEAAVGLPRYAYFPFGGGTRICVGESFAWSEAVLVLATLCQGWSFHSLSPPELELDAGITLRPRRGLPVLTRPRLPVAPAGS